VYREGYFGQKGSQELGQNELELHRECGEELNYRQNLVQKGLHKIDDVYPEATVGDLLDGPVVDKGVYVICHGPFVVIGQQSR
jgi:hypothetical protein